MTISDGASDPAQPVQAAQAVEKDPADPGAEPGHEYWYGADKQAMLGRLKRIEGQVRGVHRMVDQDTYCIDVLTQISAVQAALDEVALGLLDGHARTCVMDAPRGQRAERTTELMAAVGRFARRR
jgi:DNA-binding FrmR family transcriptional regulator